MPLALTLLGFTFAGREALIAVVIIVIVVGGIWFAMRRGR